jgi:predicted phosphodiesterase
MMKKWMYAGDIHVPYENKENVISFLKALKKEKPDVLVLGGDVIDFYKISRFDKNPLNNNSFNDELYNTRKFLVSVRKHAGKKCKIYWLEGNHEERFKKYLRNNAPELVGFTPLTMYEMFGLTDPELQVVWVPDTQVLEIDDWVFRHGHETGNGTTPGLSARKGVLMYGKNYCQGHIHRANIIRVSNFSGDFIGVESPCLCDMEPEYVKGYAGWQAGWTIGERDKRGKWQVRQTIL